MNAYMDEMEPTPGAGPCIEDVLEIDEGEFKLLFDFLTLQEHDFVDILIESDGFEVYIEGFISTDCIVVLALRIRGCGSALAEQLRAYSDWPEVSRAILEGDCIELVIPPDPPARVREAVRKLGVETPIVPRAFRIRGG